MNLQINWRKCLLLLIDLGIWTAAALTAVYLCGRWDLARLHILVVLLAAHILVFHMAGIYDIIWRYVTVEQLLGSIAVEAAVYGGVAAVGALAFHAHLFRFCCMAFACSTTLWVLSRVCYVALVTLRQGGIRPVGGEGMRTLIVGAGEATHLLLSDMRQDERKLYLPVALVDDAATKQRRKLMGVPVAGTLDQIPALVRELHIQLIVFSVFNISEDRKSKILDLCASTGCKVMKVQSMRTLHEPTEKLERKLQNIEIQDLLGRPPVVLESEENRAFIGGKSVLVTGAGGSIGSELSRQIARLRPKKLILLDIYENGVYDVQQELRRVYGGSLDLSVEIMSVDNRLLMEQMFRTYRPEILYHAAAHKHVPLMEDAPVEAVQNNVFGTLNTARLAEQYGVKRFVLVSTDKAVNPTNVMGATKRCCELVLQAMNQTSCTEFVAVRFGNVLGSNGSVVPLFERQIAAGGPVTVTHPEIIRYFMTIPEAVSLLLAAGAMAKGGEIFVLDMGKPVKILDMAEKMIRLSGLRPGKDIQIEFTGLRPGEKLFEELLLSEEGTTGTAHQKIFVGAPVQFEARRFWALLGQMERTVKTGDAGETRRLLGQLVPTYHPANAPAGGREAVQIILNPNAAAV